MRASLLAELIEGCRARCSPRPGSGHYIRQCQIDSGVPKAQAYNVTMYIMAALLSVGFIANFLIKAVDDRHHMDPETVDDLIGVAEGGRYARWQAMAGARPPPPELWLA